MVSGTYRSAAAYKHPLAFGKLTLPFLLKWTPSLSLWGSTAVVALLYFGDSIPLYRHAILEKIPVIGKNYEDKVDPEDTPF